jgi:hypothetical protein
MLDFSKTQQQGGALTLHGPTLKKAKGRNFFLGLGDRSESGVRRKPFNVSHPGLLQTLQVLGRERGHIVKFVYSEIVCPSRSDPKRPGSGLPLNASMRMMQVEATFADPSLVFTWTAQACSMQLPANGKQGYSRFAPDILRLCLMETRCNSPARPEYWPPRGEEGILMKWRGRQESTNIEDRRGRSVRRAGVGGLGGLGLIVAVVYMLMGGNPLDLLTVLQEQPTAYEQTGGSYQESAEEAQLRTFSAVVLKETEEVWNELFARSGQAYEEPTLAIYSGSVVVCGIFSKKKDHGICGLYHQTTTPGGICHGQEELYRIGI